ncbi:MAG: glycosyltransferase [Phycisphaera sp.]|nr:glycosyltransferase [Phycisphaera sp.]
MNGYVFIEIALVCLAVLLSVPVWVLFAECVLAAWPRITRGEAGTMRSPRPRIAVLVPAHNEQGVIRKTLESVGPQLHEGDRVLVVADNCSDATAALARECGAQVHERFNTVKRGKGYALDEGLCVLAQDPPDVVVVIDADCIAHEGAIETVARQAAWHKRPAQALYLMQRPDRPAARDTVSSLAFLVKNLVRPAGLSRVGMPCHLTGSGMAFPWELIRGVSIGSGNIVEDMKLGLDMAMEGEAPVFCPTARITGQLPDRDDAARSQRTRWEHGHMMTLLDHGPSLLAASVRRRSAELLALALDLCVPPLSMLVMLWALGTAVAFVGMVVMKTHFPASILLIDGALLAGAMFIAWARFARRELPLTSLLAVPGYLLWKLPMYLAFITRPQRAWVRTDRGAVTE